MYDDNVGFRRWNKIPNVWKLDPKSSKTIVAKGPIAHRAKPNHFWPRALEGWFTPFFRLSEDFGLF